MNCQHCNKQALDARGMLIALRDMPAVNSTKGRRVEVFGYPCPHGTGTYHFTSEMDSGKLYYRLDRDGKPYKHFHI